MTDVAQVPAPIVARELLKIVLQALKEVGPFLVLRNYDMLPDDWSNDIDILVAPTDLDSAFAALCRVMSDHSGPALISGLKRFNFRAARLVCADRILHIDLYAAMSKAWVIYADAETILTSRRPVHPLFDVPAPLDEPLLVAAKELFSYGRVRERYHPFLAGYDPDEALSASCTIFGSHMTPAGVRHVAHVVSDPDQYGRPSLKPGSMLRPGQVLEWARLRNNRWAKLPVQETNLR